MTLEQLGPSSLSSTVSPSLLQRWWLQVQADLSRAHTEM